MASFKELIQKSKVVLVDFSAEWCGPCQTLAPILQEVKSHYGDVMSIIKIDIDKNQALARNFAVQGVPTMIIYKEGNQVWRQSGLLPKSELIRVIDSFLEG